jgi:hypothetical protein
MAAACILKSVSPRESVCFGKPAALQNLVQRWGPWAGKILTGSETEFSGATNLFTIDTNGVADKRLTCQLVLINRSDIASGDFDLEFNYDGAQWEFGEASADFPPRAGFSNSTNTYELPHSGSLGTFVDTNYVTGLIYNSINSPVSGRYRFFFRDGEPQGPLP